uniref:Cytochrome P450 n=1 Tax=Panagrolaimus sp. JU765 TaxID=591449 RepID=A0AC34PX29_9BILA
MLFELICLFVGYYFFHHFYLKRKDLPPGPTPLPLIGNVLSIANDNVEPSLKQWTKQFGDIYTIWFGNTPLVLVNDSKTIYETFLKDGEAYAGRFYTEGFKFIRKGYCGVAFTDGPLWRDQRRFALRVLRDFGLGKNLMQERVLAVVDSLIDDVKNDVKSGKKVISLLDDIDRGVGSVITSILFGYRYNRSQNNEFRKNKKLIQDLLASGADFWWSLIDKSPEFVKHLPFLRNVTAKVQRVSDELANFYYDEINKHRSKINLNSNEEPTDFVEAFLREQHKLEKSGEKQHTFTDYQLYGMCSDLWLAGQETTSTTLGWVINYLIRHPEIQQKLQDELDQVIGSDRPVTMEDKNQLNYVNAVVAECQRMASLLLVNLWHTTTKDVEIHGYKLPAGTKITYQMSQIFNNDKYFKNPDKFDPERFLDKTGKFFSPPELIPFGIGKRVCLGEGLARMELYLFTANIFNQFKIKPAYGQMPSDHRNHKTSIVCSPFNCEIEPRYTL